MACSMLYTRTVMAETTWLGHPGEKQQDLVPGPSLQTLKLLRQARQVGQLSAPGSMVPIKKSQTVQLARPTLR